MTGEMQPFFDAMQLKFKERSVGECNRCEGTGIIMGQACIVCLGKGQMTRSLQPWQDHDWDFLVERAIDEMNEFIMAVRENEPVRFLADAADELIDVSNFFGFLWMKWRGEQKLDWSPEGYVKTATDIARRLS